MWIKPWRTARNAVYYRAVVHPFRLRSKKAPKPVNQLERYANLIKAYRRWIVIAQQGHESALPWRQMYLCTPVGVRCRGLKKSISCKQRSLCPWCYMRFVVGEIYDAVEFARRQHAALSQFRPLLTPAVYRDNWVIRQKGVPRPKDWSHPHFEQHWRRLMAERDPLAAVRLHMAYPSSNKSWVLEQRVLFWEPEGEQSIGSQDVVADLSDLCFFPQSLLQLSHSAEVLQYLTNRRPKSRMFTTVRLFNNASSRRYFKRLNRK